MGVETHQGRHLGLRLRAIGVEANSELLSDGQPILASATARKHTVDLARPNVIACSKDSQPCQYQSGLPVCVCSRDRATERTAKQTR